MLHKIVMKTKLFELEQYLAHSKSSIPIGDSFIILLLLLFLNVYFISNMLHCEPGQYLLKDFTYLFLDRGEGVKEKGRETLMCGFLLGTWPAIQECVLTGNQTHNALVHGLVLNPLSHTTQGNK